MERKINNDIDVELLYKKSKRKNINNTFSSSSIIIFVLFFNI